MWETAINPSFGNDLYKFMVILGLVHIGFPAFIRGHFFIQPCLPIAPRNSVKDHLGNEVWLDRM